MPSASMMCLLVSLAVAQAPPPSKTLWLVRPLFPGQEMLSDRAEERLNHILREDAAQHVIGPGRLALHLGRRQADLTCLTGGPGCADPADALLANLGLERIVLLKVGQEEANYQVAATSLRPRAGEQAYAEGKGTSLDRAILSALVKIYPLAATLEVTSEPLGAVVFVDGERVGQTPYSGQVLAGERTVRLELAKHVVVERKLEVAVRSAAKLAQVLEKVPARLVISALPEGTSIRIDGADAGKDKLDKPIAPGKHRIALSREGYEPLEEEVAVAPDATVTFERTLAPTTWTSVRSVMRAAEEDIYGRSGYLHMSFESAWLNGTRITALENPAKEDGRGADSVLSSKALSGVSAEYGTDGRYFGLMVVGAAYAQGGPWNLTLKNVPDVFESEGEVRALTFRALQPHLRFAVWRVTLRVQAGLEARALIVSPTAEVPTLYVVDLQAVGQAGLRAQLLAGLYLEGVYRHGWSLGGTSPFQGLRVGVGYAF